MAQTQADMQRSFAHLFSTLNTVDWKLTKEQAALVEAAGGAISHLTAPQGSGPASEQPPQPPAPEPAAVNSEFSPSPASPDWHTPSSAMTGTAPVDPVAASAPRLAVTASPASWPSPKEAQLTASRRELVRNRSNEEAPDAKQSRGNTDS